MIKRKLATIESTGKLSALGGLLGPINTPSYFEINIIINLINSGKIVYEVNPSDMSQKIRLTRENVLRDNFNQKINTQKHTECIKSSDVGLTKVNIKPSGVTLNISDNKSKSSIVFDDFISNINS